MRFLNTNNDKWADKVANKVRECIFHSPHKLFKIEEEKSNYNHIDFNDIKYVAIFSIDSIGKSFVDSIISTQSEKYGLKKEIETKYKTALCMLFLLENDICSVKFKKDGPVEYYSQITRNPKLMGTNTHNIDWVLNGNILEQLERNELRVMLVDEFGKFDIGTINPLETSLSLLSNVMDLKNNITIAARKSPIAIIYRGEYYLCSVSFEILINCIEENAQIGSLNTSPELHLPVIDNTSTKYYTKRFNVFDIEDIYPAPY